METEDNFQQFRPENYSQLYDWNDLESAFDDLYYRAENLNREFQSGLCDIRNEQCARGRSTGQPSFCCSRNSCLSHGETERCEHLREGGCTVQSIRCRLWFCDSIVTGTRSITIATGFRKSFTTANLDGAAALVREADHYGFLVHRGTREQSIKQAARKWKIPPPN